MRFSVLAIGVAFCLLIHAGCAEKIKPGTTYNLSIITKSNDGKLTPQEPATQVGGANVESVQEISHEDQTYSVKVRKTQYGKATFEIVFPDNTREQVQVKAGEAKDILPKGKKVGVRIELVDSH
jgi:hypothetical protein